MSEAKLARVFYRSKSQGRCAGTGVTGRTGFCSVPPDAFDEVIDRMWAQTT